MKKPFGVDAVLGLCICIVSHSIGQLITDTEIGAKKAQKVTFIILKAGFSHCGLMLHLKKGIF
jgi:hypothetical protein